MRKRNFLLMPFLVTEKFLSQREKRREHGRVREGSEKGKRREDERGERRGRGESKRGDEEMAKRGDENTERNFSSRGKFLSREKERVRERARESWIGERELLATGKISVAREGR